VVRIGERRCRAERDRTRDQRAEDRRDDQEAASRASPLGAGRATDLSSFTHSVLTESGC
jgi:hypothetical protein